MGETMEFHFDRNITADRNDVSEAIVYAVRYALGRRSYAVGSVCGIVRRLFMCLAPNDVETIARDISDAISQENCGDDIDRKSWRQLLDDMKGG
jgi:hypothetical protein